MRGIIVATVLSAILWSLLGWCVVCTCTWIDLTRFSSSLVDQCASLACIGCATLIGACWVVFMCIDNDSENETAPDQAAVTE